MTIEEFLEARINDLEAKARVSFEQHLRIGALAAAECLRLVLEHHKRWPVLVESPTKFENSEQNPSLDSMTFRMTKNIAWMTNQSYIETFGTEAPTSALLADMLRVYQDHPDFNPEWIGEEPT